jgi:small subunit ribosomal protein S8
MFAVINNASLCNSGEVSVPTNKKCLKVLELMYREGFIRGYSYNKYRTKIYIKFAGATSKPVIKFIQAISTNGRKVYVNIKILAKLIQLKETFFISTTKGLLTLQEALKHNVGGVLFCKIIS